MRYLDDHYMLVSYWLVLLAEGFGRAEAERRFRHVVGQSETRYAAAWRTLRN